jgi:F420-0:gamma-glutamyl ligase
MIKKAASFSTRAVRTDFFRIGQDLADFVIAQIGKSSEKLENGDVLAITSKIVSLSENRLVSKNDIDKKTLVERESDHYLGEIGYGCHLTIKHGLLIPSAGIDESNSEGGAYILFPEDPFASLRILHEKLCSHLKLDQLGLIMTDSHTTPLRRGVTGIALAYWGIRGTRNFVGRPDLFGRTLQMTHVNIVDALASAAVFVMGEADERCPLAIIGGVDLEFLPLGEAVNTAEVQIPPEEDLYAPLFRSDRSR